MKYFLSGNAKPEFYDYIVENISPNYYYLCSYYYTRKELNIFNKLLNNFENILIDSGAFGLQRGVKANFDEYTKEYAKFIKKYDNEKILGYFEMDIDVMVGYEKVLEYRKQLEEVSDKIIPVWHKNRGINDFKEMCKNYDYVAITNKATDIEPSVKQLKIFVDYAHKHDARIHGLGVSAKKYLNNIPFDSVDSTNYLHPVRFARLNGKRLNSDYTRKNYLTVLVLSYLQERENQIYYYNKWKKICKWED